MRIWEIPARREIPETQEIPVREIARREKFEAIREGRNRNFPLNITVLCLRAHPYIGNITPTRARHAAVTTRQTSVAAAGARQTQKKLDNNGVMETTLEWEVEN